VFIIEVGVAREPLFLPPSPSSKPKNQRVKRALEERAPKLVENTKTAMFIRGGRISEKVTQAMKELVRRELKRSICLQCNRGCLVKSWCLI